MKKVISFFTILGLLFIVGLIVAGFAYAKDSTLDPDSMVNYLDPQNAPQFAAPEATGLMGLEARGTAAGGVREDPDSMVHFLDPQNAPRTVIGPSAKAVPDDPDSIINFISPTGK